MERAAETSTGEAGVPSGGEAALGASVGTEILTGGAAAGTGNGEAALEVRNLEVAYNRRAPVLRGVSLVVPRHAIVALLGPNGSGKTTTLRAVSGLLDVHDGEISKGSVWLRGRDVTDVPAPHLVRQGVAQVLEGRQVFPALTVEENLRTGAHTRRRDRPGVRSDLDEVFGRFPLLAPLRQRPAGFLSGGEQQMLAIGRALMARPRLLLLDEPSLGLAPRMVDQMCEAIVSINREGTTVLLVEQNALMGLSIAQHGYVLEAGRVVMDAPASRLLRDEDIREFYLGLRSGSATDYRTVKHYRRRKRWLS
jgi:branched-chain amino acid transport system ATP-binding protein